MKTNHITFYQFCSAVRRNAALAFCVALCMLGLGLSASAQKHGPTFTTFDAPGAGTDPNGGTYAWGINDQGVIMGWYLDANFVHQSFLRDPHGRFTTVAVPGAGTGWCQGTLAWGLNLEGAITGNYIDPNDVFHGFLRDPHGRITTFDAPGAGTTGVPFSSLNAWTSVVDGLNPAGAITGSYIDGNNVNHGFLRDPHGTFTTIDAPGAGITGDHGTWPNSINPEGAIVGAVCDDGGMCQSFLRNPRGRFTTFQVPGEGNESTTAMHINSVGAITGYYSDANGGAHGFVRAPDGRFTTIDVPGAPDTVPNSINSAGVITGWYVDANNVAHGFLWTP